jgi:O-antigen/teichoic acid export membrane protein
MLMWTAVHLAGPHLNTVITGNIAGGALAALTGKILTEKALGKQHTLRNPTNSERNENVHNFSERIKKRSRAMLLATAFTNSGEVLTRYIVAGGLGVEKAGLFQAVYGILKRPAGMISDIGYTVMTPICQMAIADGDKKRQKAMKANWILLVTLLSACLVMAVVLFQENIQALFLPGKFSTASGQMTKLAVALITVNIAQAFTSELLIEAKDRIATASSALGVTTIVLILLLTMKIAELTAIPFAIAGGAIVQIASAWIWSKKAEKEMNERADN